MDDFINEVTTYTQQYMSNYDPSHDYNHIQRVLALAQTIERRENATNPTTHYRSHIITLACLLHDIGDHKYLKPGEDGTTMVEKLLLSFNAPADLAHEIQTIASHVSYSKELKDSSRVTECIKKHPELAVVQDADRLDALGAHGTARTFVYHGLKGDVLQSAVDHLGGKLEKVEGLMKTESGREIARVRIERVKEFGKWWEEEGKCDA